MPKDASLLPNLAKAIQSLLGYPIRNAQLAEFPAILDSFYQQHQHLYRVVGGGWWRDTKYGLQQSSASFRWNGLDCGPIALRMSQNIAK